MAAIDIETLPEKSRFGMVRQIAGIVLQAIGLIFAIALAIGVGIWSSRAMVSRGSALSTDMYGPWQQWRDSGRAAADPYTRAHLAVTGKMLISADSAGIFEARIDSTGARLHSSCDYVIEGPAMPGVWWSMAVFDANGRLINNDAKRYAFTSDTIAPDPDGTFLVTLGRDARPGNWLPTRGAGRLVLVFTILDPATGLSSEQRALRNNTLPTIRREDCS